MRIIEVDDPVKIILAKQEVEQKLMDEKKLDAPMSILDAPVSISATIEVIGDLCPTILSLAALRRARIYLSPAV